ncbi:MAG: A/G-specific adenine glycosylase [Bacteroidales bacterium]|nr:A/G-specific adenine glycosylase [Bacteroidales bacterium]
MRENFWELLSVWYGKNKRDLPWRRTNDPYAIWLSEIILQQTRINQGLSYYLKFLEAYPDVFSLAKASKDEVYKLWQGLGYYNRADNLMKTAKVVSEQYEGVFPQNLELLKVLPGIGDYTAAAIASLAFGIPAPVVDGNVYRVLSRIFGIATPIDTGRGKTEFTAKAGQLMQNQNPSEFNQALMEFGALHCLPSSPDCKNCIFNHRCVAYKTGTQMDLPVKKPKVAVRDRYIYYFVIQTSSERESSLYIKKRETRDIWRNLYDFPSIESDKALTGPAEAITLAKDQGLFPYQEYDLGKVSGIYEHKLTHLRIFAQFIPIILTEPVGKEHKNSLLLIKQSELNKYPVPQLIVRYLQDQKIIH